MSAEADIDADPDSGTELDASGDADIGTANTMREHADESRLKLWVLLSANRLFVTAALAVLVFAAFVFVGTVFYLPSRRASSRATPSRPSSRRRSAR